MTTLYGRAHPATTLDDALARAGFTDAVALLSAPHAHRVARIHEGRCHTHDAAPRPLEAVFDARVFDGRRELRWLCTAGREGQAVLLGEDPTDLPTGFGDALPDLHAEYTLPSYYLLWGHPRPATGAWTALHTPRIGTLHVPVPPPPPGCRLRLVAREYVCIESRHGNAHVAEERLLRIEPTEPTKPTELAEPDTAAAIGRTSAGQTSPGRTAAVPSRPTPAGTGTVTGTGPAPEGGTDA